MGPHDPLPSQNPSRHPWSLQTTHVFPHGWFSHGSGIVELVVNVPSVVLALDTA
jgi:hypothetical protein